MAVLVGRAALPLNLTAAPGLPNRKPTGPDVPWAVCASMVAGSPGPGSLDAGLFPGLAGGLLLAEPGPAPQLARLLVVLVGAELFLHSATFDQLLEPTQCQRDWF